ncbi:hypothetical protein [Streptomyces clavifer]|uniref:hypothetical protein n=1 Tax=Streptomyces clavifer TaxID=68188 RepID=UPI002E812DF7|nr:hypothetical protein [Streptomyces clavifer]WUC29771.1 hypothetical protein OG927_21510 [Streptomyces clavifer]
MILTRGAGITGAVLCAVLGAVVAGWIVRDVRAVGEPLELLRFWAGYADARPEALPATSQGDPVLLAVYVLTAFAALRSPVAASALVAAGVVTLALRLPGLWTISASWRDGQYADELRTRALIGTFVALAAALALVITGAAGRRQPVDLDEPRPTRPGRGASVAVFLVLGAAGAVLIAWEIRQFVTLPSAFYPDWFTGGGAVRSGLTDPPPGWSSVALAVLCLVVAFTALFRAVHARPFGMIAAGFVLVSGCLGIARAVHHGMLDDFGGLGTEYQLLVLTSFFLALAGVTGLLALSRKGQEDTDGGSQGYGGYGYPPSAGYGYPPSAGYGYPPAGTPGYGYPPAAPPGHGHPQQGPPGGPGQFGPPPPSSPPPGW